MITEVHTTGIHKFMAEIDSFPASLNTYITEYDTGKLMKILQEKEVIENCGISKNDFDRVNSIDLEFGKVSAMMLQQKNLEAAIALYQVLEQRLEDEFSGNLYLYAKQGALSIKALYHYKNKEYERAITLTVECIAVVDYLIGLGIGTLYLRSIEQNKNISRVYFRQKRINEAYELIHSLLNCLLNGKGKKIFGSIAQYKSSWDKAPILREIYMYDLFRMFTEDMIRFNMNNKTDYLPMKWYQDLEFDVNTSDRQVIYNWIYINNQLHSGNLGEYFNSLTYYFQQPVNWFYDILKMSLLVDLAKVVRKNNYAEKELIMGKLKTYLLTKLNRQPELREELAQTMFEL